MITDLRRRGLRRVFWPATRKPRPRTLRHHLRPRATVATVSPSPASESIAQFHELYYGAAGQTWQNTFWLGVRTAKCPFDLWIYQEILWETRPDLIVECGTAWGGSALFLASVLDQLGFGAVVTIDVATAPDRPSSPAHQLHVGVVDQSGSWWLRFGAWPLPRSA